MLEHGKKIHTSKANSLDQATATSPNLYSYTERTGPLSRVLHSLLAVVRSLADRSETGTIHGSMMLLLLRVASGVHHALARDTASSRHLHSRARSVAMLHKSLLLHLWLLLGRAEATSHVAALLLLGHEASLWC